MALAREKRLTLGVVLAIVAIAGSTVLREATPEAASTPVELTEYEQRHLDELRHVLRLNRLWREGSLDERPPSPAIEGRGSVSPFRRHTSPSPDPAARLVEGSHDDVI
jgi:hypothetical protein